MKTKTKIMATTIVGKVKTFARKNGVNRITVGAALCIGSLLYLLVLADVQGRKDVIGNILYILDGFAFIGGLLVITKSYEKMSSILNRILFESFALLFAIYSLIEINRCMTHPFNRLGAIHQVMAFVTIIFMTWYLARFAKFLFTLIKETVSKIVDKIKVKDIKSKSEILDVVLKNLLSILGTIGLLYKFFEPLINRLLGI